MFGDGDTEAGRQREREAVFALFIQNAHKVLNCVQQPFFPFSSCVARAPPLLHILHLQTEDAETVLNEFEDLVDERITQNCHLPRRSVNSNFARHLSALDNNSNPVKINCRSGSC